MKYLILRNHILQADSAEIMNAWILALHKRIDAAIHEYRDSDGTMNAFNDSIPGARRIQRMYVLMNWTVFCVIITFEI